MRQAAIIGVGAALLAVAAYVMQQRKDQAAADQLSTDDTEPTMLDDLQGSASEAINRIMGYSAASMDISPAGVAAIQSHEGCRLTRYRLGDGGWTIGWGRYFKDGGPVPPELITQDQADAWLSEDIEAKAAKWVRAYVTANVTQSQFDALCSWAYNLSPASFKKIAAAVNDGQDPEGVALQFVREGTNLERGLRRRRAQEIALYRAEGIAA